MLGNRFAESLSLAGIVACRLESRLRHADRLCGNPNTPSFQIGKRDTIAFALLAKPVLRRNFHSVESDLAGVRRVETKLLFDPQDLVAWRVRRHDKGPDAVLSRAWISDGDDNGDMAVLDRGDELLATFDDVVIALAPRPGLQVQGIRPRLRFREGKAADPFAGGQVRQKALPLLPCRTSEWERNPPSYGHS